MRLALTGKGGSGKTALAALLARTFAERGRMVLAVDLDVNPGLALSLGGPLNDQLLPDDAIEERASAPYGWALAEHLTPAEAVRRCGIRVDPRIVYLGFGNIARAEHSVRRYITAVRQVAEQFEEPGWVVVMDLAAGPTALFEGHAQAANLALVVAEPTPASMLGAQRLTSILRHDGTPTAVVMNETRPWEGRSGAFGDPGLAPLSAVPFDAELARLEQAGSSCALPSDSRALAAVRALASRIEEGSGIGASHDVELLFSGGSSR